MAFWLLLAIAAATAAPAAADPFPQVTAQNAGVHQPAIDALNHHFEGVFEGTGCEDGLCPSEPLERWEMAVWLVRVLDPAEPPVPRTSRFHDILDDTWWAAHTERLAELAITRGCAAGPPRYCPYDHVTRGQMATFLARAFDLPWAPVAGFADVPATGAHSADIDILAGAGVTAGCATRPARYCPQEPVTRAQMATFLARVTGIVETPKPQPPTYAAIAAGGFHTCAINGSGSIECWGNNEDGQTSPPPGAYTAIAAGGFHTCAINGGGSIECWGYDADGQASPPSGPYTAISAGGFHTCALDTVGSIECWGNKNWNQATPTPGSYTAITAGWQHTCAIDTVGGIECWGNNNWNQATPTPGSYTAIAAGGFHTCGIATDRRIECWGSDDRDQATPPPGSYTTITAGWQHTCALDTGGSIECWGDDSIRQTSPPSGSHTSITAGAFHTCALATTKTAACWGNNENGQTITPRRATE